MEARILPGAMKILRQPFIRIICNQVYYSSGEWGSGAGKGGGSGGSVRDAGGVFGKMEAAREEEYFRKLQKKQIMKLKQHLSDEITHHERMIAQHEEAIARHKGRIKGLKQEEETHKSAEKKMPEP